MIVFSRRSHAAVLRLAVVERGLADSVLTAKIGSLHPRSRSQGQLHNNLKAADPRQACRGLHCHSLSISGLLVELIAGWLTRRNWSLIDKEVNRKSKRLTQRKDVIVIARKRSY
jgi:hypothetical protein